MSTTQEWMAEFDHIEDNGKAAVEALNDLGRLSKRTRTLLLPILTEAFLMYRRTATRNVERRVPVEAVFTDQTSLEQRRHRLEATFALPDGRRVSWDDATEAEHLARIGYLQKHIAGIEETIDSHRAAVALIREHGVSCLAEIGEAA